MLEDQLLVWRFNRGRTDALRDIYERHKVGLVTLATTLLVDKSAAEDVVHDVFVGFLQSAGRFRLTGSLRGFLATCVANRARNHNKARRRLAPGDERPPDPLAPETEQPDHAAVFDEAHREIGQALARLPYEQREVVVLRLQARMRFRAIAQVQAVSINTVQGRYRYGLERLRSQLNGEFRP